MLLTPMHSDENPVRRGFYVTSESQGLALGRRFTDVSHLHLLTLFLEKW